jgi:hypothetical protein
MTIRTDEEELAEQAQTATDAIRATVLRLLTNLLGSNPTPAAAFLLRWYVRHIHRRLVRRAKSTRT